MAQQPISLASLASEVSEIWDGWNLCVHRRTGEIGSYPDDTMGEPELEAEVYAAPEWLHLSYPDPDLDQRAMWDFAYSRPAETREPLLRALGGRRPFGRFRDEARRLGLLDAWRAFHRGRVADDLRAYLRHEELEFVDDIAT